jgi:hypothetical protein
MHSCGEGEGAVSGVPVSDASRIRADSMVVLVLLVAIHGGGGGPRGVDICRVRGSCTKLRRKESSDLQQSFQTVLAGRLRSG